MLETINTIVITIAAGVICHIICKRLDGKK